MTSFDRTLVGMKSIDIATVSQRNSAEADCIITIIDEDVVGFNIFPDCGIRTAVGRVISYGN